MTAGGADVDVWPAPVAAGPVNAEVTVPGSKSITNRALILAALAEGPSMVRRPLCARDTTLMAAALRSLGVGIEEPESAEHDWRVTPRALTGETRVDVGNAGTVMRFVPPVACLADGPVVFDGDPRARERPLGPMLDALRALGADIEAGERGGMPITVHGHGGLSGGEVTIDASTSSQLVSGLLLAGPRFERGAMIRHVGPAVPSLPHIAMTVDMLRARGVQAEAVGAREWRVGPGTIDAVDVDVEPDLSNAAPFLAAAMVTGGTVTVREWPAPTTQPGDALPDLFEAMGATCQRRDGAVTVAGPDPAELSGLHADLHDVGELTPVLAAVCAVAAGPSRLTGIAHLRRHETDRLAALANELSRFGARVMETDDGLLIAPVNPSTDLHGGVFRTFDDHRLAMAGAVLGLVVPGVGIGDVATTAKTFPDFGDRWLAMLEPQAQEERLHARMDGP